MSKDEIRDMHVACCRICLIANAKKTCKLCPFYKDAKGQSPEIKEEK